MDFTLTVDVHVAEDALEDGDIMSHPNYTPFTTELSAYGVLSKIVAERSEGLDPEKLAMVVRAPELPEDASDETKRQAKKTTDLVELLQDGVPLELAMLMVSLQNAEGV